jgi:DNA-binding HxlR family transcriptional regulator
MQKYWEFTQKNVFSELLSLLGRMTQENLIQQIEYLKVENDILRKRVGRSIRPTSLERRRLLKFGAPLRNIRNTFQYKAETYLRPIGKVYHTFALCGS